MAKKTDDMTTYSKLRMRKIYKRASLCKDLYGVFARHFGDFYEHLTEDEKELMTEIKEAVSK